MTTTTWHERWRDLEVKAMQAAQAYANSPMRFAMVSLPPPANRSPTTDLLAAWDQAQSDVDEFLRNTAAEVAALVDGIEMYLQFGGQEQLRSVRNAKDALDRRVKELQDERNSSL